MKIYTEINLADFEAWSGGQDTLNIIYNKGKIRELEVILEELYPNGMTETDLNDLLRFDDKMVFEWLGIRTAKEVEEELFETCKELEELLENFEEECEDLELEEDEKQVLWESEYKGEAGYLEDKIKELEEELEDY